MISTCFFFFFFVFFYMSNWLSPGHAKLYLFLLSLSQLSAAHHPLHLLEQEDPLPTQLLLAVGVVHVSLLRLLEALPFGHPAFALLLAPLRLLPARIGRLPLTTALRDFLIEVTGSAGFP